MDDGFLGDAYLSRWYIVNLRRILLGRVLLSKHGGCNYVSSNKTDGDLVEPHWSNGFVSKGNTD